MSVELTDSADYLEGTILIPLAANPGVALSSCMSLIKQDCVCLCVRGLAGDQAYKFEQQCTAAIIEKQQSHQQANKASLRGRFCCFHPYKPSFHVLWSKLSLIYSPELLELLLLQKGGSWKWASDVYFSYSHWRETGCSSVNFPISVVTAIWFS